ncbi:uncharacterized protein PAC_13060 [Phialocephala subalpina]|uniref:Uncharacterized protein n=1 Tax=Phialocephala subalpina TaxID=576137 RepID=A0A1L7XDS2_9HELO|nr:uncharacterized protein PAC_13060 [Phialocephala subalpina]
MHFQFILLGASLLSLATASINFEYKHKRQGDLTTNTVTGTPPCLLLLSSLLFPNFSISTQKLNAPASSSTTIQLSELSAVPASSSDSTDAVASTDLTATSTDAAASATDAIDSTTTAESTPLFQSHPFTTTSSNSTFTATKYSSSEKVTSSRRHVSLPIFPFYFRPLSTLTPKPLDDFTELTDQTATTSGAVATSTPKSAAGKTLDARGWCVVLSVIFGAWGAVGIFFGLGVGGWI